jgi:hypothetical protein
MADYSDKVYVIQIHFTLRANSLRCPTSYGASAGKVLVSIFIAAQTPGQKRQADKQPGISGCRSVSSYMKPATIASLRHGSPMMQSARLVPLDSWSESDITFIYGYYNRVLIAFFDRPVAVVGGFVLFFPVLATSVF